MSSDANLEQRVFDVFPAHPGIVTLNSLMRELPFSKGSVLKALQRLRECARIEIAPPNVCCVYRLVKDARRPIDMRGQHGNSGRRPKAA